MVIALQSTHSHGPTFGGERFNRTTQSVEHGDHEGVALPHSGEGLIEARPCAV